MINTKYRLIIIQTLVCFALLILTCALKNYLVFLVAGTSLCSYLCPSIMVVELSFGQPLLEPFFAAQGWVYETVDGLVKETIEDPYNLTMALIFVPVMEELIYRGPMFLFRGVKSELLWWLIGVALTAVFAMSHGRNGLALLPLIMLGICSLWLIKKTQLFWPSILLHFLYNFFFSSVLIYQSLWFSD